MNKVYIVKDKTDANFNKPFVSIHKTQESAVQQVSNIKNRLSNHLHQMISYEAVNVDDFDINKNSIYILFDKTDKNKKPFVSMHFELNNAVKCLGDLRKKSSHHAQKLIYTSCEKIQ